MRRSIIALCVASLLASPALAQSPPAPATAAGPEVQSNISTIAPTAPINDSTDRIANTQFVSRAVASAVPSLPAAQIFVGSASNIATPQTFSGDGTLSVGGVFSLLAVNSNVGNFGSATQCLSLTTNAKGLITAASAATCTPAFSSLTGQATLAQFPNIGANTVLGNATSSAAVPAALAVPSCSSAASALTWTTNSGYACNTSITAAAVPLSGITGLGTGVATAAANPVNALGGFVTYGGSAGTLTANINGNAGTVTTNANLSGDVTSVGNVTSLQNAPVIAKLLTGFTSGAGTITASDSILTAFQKLSGNDGQKLPLAGGTMSGAIAMGGNAITGAGAITGTAITGTSYSGLPTATSAALGVVKPDGTTITVNGSGVIQAVGATANSIDAAGGTSVTNGTAGYVLNNNGGKVGNFSPAPIKTSLSSDLSLSSSGTYFSGPSVAQGTTGTWWACADAVITNTSSTDNVTVKLWDGTTVFGSNQASINAANFFSGLHVCGFITNPAGNIRADFMSTGSSTSVVKFNRTGLSQDTSVVAHRLY